MRTSLISAVALVMTVSACTTSGTDPAGDTLVAGSWPVQVLLAELLTPTGSPSSFSIIDLAPPGVEPHDLELTAEDQVAIERAHAVVYVGGGFQPSLERAVKAERDIDLLTLFDDPLEATDSAEVDPHVWLDPGRWATIARQLGAELAARDAPRAVLAAAERTAVALETLDAAFDDGLRTCARRELYTEHAAFAYLADAYGLEQVALTGIAPEAEATAPRLQAVAQRTRTDRATTVFAERGGEGRLARTLAEAAGGLQVRELDPLEFAFDASETYAERMRSNLVTLRTALDCA